MGVDPQWGLLGGNNALSMFQVGAQMGAQARERRERAEYRNALLAEKKADREATQAKEANQQRRADAPLMARLLEHAAKGPEQWQQSLTAAQRYGIPLDNVPPAFDPAWAQQQAATMKLISTPEGKEALSTAGKIASDMGFQPGTPEYSAKVVELWQAEQEKLVTTQAGGAAGIYRPGAGYQPLIAPNDGAQPFGAPASGAPAADDDEWEVVGGAGSNAGGGFP